MSFKRNDIVNKQRLRDALEEDTSMGFAHNDIVTTYAMDKAIAEGGGGGGGLTPYTVTLAYANEEVSHKYFQGGLEYDATYGDAVESLLIVNDKFFAQVNSGVAAGTYGILPLYEGGGGYFSVADATGATITGDAAIIYDEGFESYYVKVTGDCSITFTE